MLEQHLRLPLIRQPMVHFHLAAQPRMKSRESEGNVSIRVHAEEVQTASYQVIPQQLHDQG